MNCMAKDVAESYSYSIRQFLEDLARRLNVSLNKLIDIYFWLSNNVKARELNLEDVVNRPTRADIISIVDDGKSIVGIRLRFSSDTRKGQYYYTNVGRYGAKCTCEGNMIGGRLCKHIIAGLILMNVVNLLKYGSNIDLSQFTWLNNANGVDLDSEG